jgi:hypothetical protein
MGLHTCANVQEGFAASVVIVEIGKATVPVEMGWGGNDWGLCPIRVNKVTAEGNITKKNFGRL